MFYLIQHMWLYLLLAAILGAFLMWLLRHWVMRDEVAEVQAAWQSRWNSLENEHLRVSKELQSASARAVLVPGLEADLENLQANYQTLTDQHAALDTDWKKKYGALEIDWRGRLAAAEKGMADLRMQLNTSAQERETLKADLEACSQKYTALEHESLQARVQIDDWARRFAGVEKDANEAKTQIVTLINERDRLRDDARAALVRSQAEDQAWQQRLTATEQERDNFKAEIAKITASESEWHKKWQEVEGKHADAQQQVAALTTRLAVIEALETERGKLQTEVTDWSIKHAAVRMEADGYAAQVRQLTDRVSAVEADQKSRYDNLNADWKAKWAALEARYKVAEERLGGDIERIEGIGAAFGQRLRSIGIAWVIDLLDQCGTADGRAAVAEKTGFTTAQLLTWTNIADLLRIPGVTPDWAELLNAAGIDSVKELKQRVPENLQQKMEEVNVTAERKISPTVPNVVTVNGWVQHAKTMKYRITH